jgi:hypothetical protein
MSDARQVFTGCLITLDEITGGRWIVRREIVTRGAVERFEQIAGPFETRHAAEEWIDSIPPEDIEEAWQ